MNHTVWFRLGDHFRCSKCQEWLPNEFESSECSPLPVAAELISLPLTEALKVKFERGRAARGAVEGEFVGDPICELFEEMLDAWHYCKEARKVQDEHSETLFGYQTKFAGVALELQSIWRARR